MYGYKQIWGDHYYLYSESCKAVVFMRYGFYFYSSSDIKEQNIDLTSVDQSRSANILECSEYISYEGFLDVPSEGISTITFKYGYVIFANEENFVDENSTDIRTWYKLEEVRTFKIKRNPNRKYDHHQLRYFFLPFWGKMMPMFIINYFSEVKDDYITVRYQEYLYSTNLLIVINPFNSTIKINEKMRIYEKDLIHYQELDKIENVRCVIAQPIRSLFYDFKMVVNQYIQNPAVNEYNFFKIMWQGILRTESIDYVPKPKYQEFNYPKYGQFFIRLTEEKRIIDIEAGTSVLINCDDFSGIEAVSQFDKFEVNLLKSGIMNIEYKENGLLILSYEGRFKSKYAFLVFYQKEDSECVMAIVFGTLNLSFFANSRNPRKDQIQIKDGECQDLYVFFSYKDTKIRIPENSNFALKYKNIFEPNATRIINDVGEYFEDPMMIKIKPTDTKSESSFTISIDNPYAVEKSYLITENSEYKSVVSSDFNKNPNPNPGNNSEQEPNENSTTTSIPDNNPTSEQPKDNLHGDKPNKKNTVGIIVGVLVALIAIAAASVIGFIIYKRKNNSKEETVEVQYKWERSEDEIDI
ncbi:hypothetical protein TVAG_188650 [Trichomonas vaginalis G3]|uniref:Uncharacterized protein n=1 Tax=Trichomonas vaginalis (strain ATCC PRA-98 / G3) TaxID=412133 RepID=A2EEY0_TRIV3|nr:hypothetical protein TVAGG3_0471960 [Trichomonas vaginalis G3]EAY08778.1 hypothetical protein TVAG_188650 [Trichomonas vaginalis G3]KAI5515126.1 hypothetical protein TVAGG3_0471960 [Trichomonas vaginalis G3]|eukprot:XP_001321001.1 hypothetical protein [Trichomonas vaginalis G3]